MAEGEKVSMGVISISIKGDADQASQSVKKLSENLGGLKSALKAAGAAAFAIGLKQVFSSLTDLIKKQSDFMQTMQNFKNIMHDTTGEAQNFINETERLLGFDPKQSMEAMSTFQRLAEGFGIGSESATLMSRNLTQLAMDMTTTGLTFEAAGQKLRSGFAGEIEPMRAFGVALDKVTLQQTLYKLGIDRTYDSLSRAQKTELIYYQIMTQTANLQGSIAQQALSPATAFRLVQTSMERLARSVGSVFIPIFMKIIPIILAVTQVLERLAKRLAELFGFKIEDYVKDFSGVSTSLGGVSDGLDDVGGSARKANKELQKMLMPFDELNNVNFETGSSAASGVGNLAGAGGSLGIDLPDYDLLGMLDKNGYFGDIDGIADSLIRNLPQIADAISLFFMALGKTKIGGAIKAIQSLGEIFSSIKDIIDNGANFNNVTSLIEGLGGFITAIGIFTGNAKLIGAGLIIEGFTGVIKEIGRNWEQIKKGDWSGIDKVKLITSLIEGFGGLAVVLFTVFRKIKKVQDANKAASAIQQTAQNVSNVDSNVGKLSPRLTSLAKNLGMGILIIGEVIVAGALIAGAIWGLGLAFQQIIQAWQPVLENGDTLLPALVLGTAILVGIGFATSMIGEAGKTLATSMLLGVAILLEIGVATALFVGGIWAIGWGLGKVLEAWTPVLANGDLVLASIVTGTAILIAIGAATALLGIATVATGGLLPLAILAGALMLAELELVSLEFIEGIQAIGIGLGQILIAWAPVLANAPIVEQAIVYGTTLLVAIGAASAALGVASIASVGLLPLAIALGTAMLKQLTNATIDFINNLAKVAKELTENLSPQLRRLNSRLPELNDNLNKYINFMKVFGTYTVNFTKASAVAGFSNNVRTIVSWFTGKPIERFANDVNKNYREVSNLNNKLRQANPELATAITLLTSYFNFLDQLDRLTGQNNTFKISSNMFINMKEVGKNLVLGFADGIRSQSWNLNNTINSVINNAFSNSSGYYTGLSFGYNIARGIGDAMRRSYYPRLISSMQSNYGVVSVKFNAYAEGGFPENGELFLANENGAELIGNIGNRTAVANQDQITEGIATATYGAMSRALQENRGSQTINPFFEINLGNDKLYSGYAKHKNEQNNKYGITL